MDRLHPPDFYVPAHQAIFEAMRELFDGNQAIDAVTVSEALRRRGELDKIGGVSYLARLVDIVPSTSNILYYSGIVEEHAKRRELIRAGATVTDVAFDIDEEIAHVLDRAEQAVLSVGVRVRPRSPLTEYFAAVARRYRGCAYSYWFDAGGCRFFGNCSLPHIGWRGNRLSTRVFAASRPTKRMSSSTALPGVPRARGSG